MFNSYPLPRAVYCISSNSAVSEIKLKDSILWEKSRSLHLHLTVPKTLPKSRYFGPGIWTWDPPPTTTVDLPADRVLAPGPAFHFVDPEFERFALSWLNG